MRDNDLYIENELNYLSGYQPGPKTFDYTVSTTHADGQKYWFGTDPSEQLSILHKINTPPQDTLTLVNSPDRGSNTTYLIKYSTLYLAGTTTSNGGKIIQSTDGMNWTTTVAGRSFAYHKDDEKLLVGLNNTIMLVKISQEIAPDGTPYENVTLSDILDGNIGNGGYATAINVDEDRTMYVGTQDGRILTATLPPYDEMGTSSGKVTLHDVGQNLVDGGQVNDFVFRDRDNQAFTDRNFILASLSNGIAESDFQSRMVDERFYLSGTDITEMVQLQAGSKAGIYASGPNGLSTVAENISKILDG